MKKKLAILAAAAVMTMALAAGPASAGGLIDELFSDDHPTYASSGDRWIIA